MSGAWLLSTLLLTGTAVGQGGFGRLFTSPGQRAELERRWAPAAVPGAPAGTVAVSKASSEAPAEPSRPNLPPDLRFNGYLRGPDCTVLWIDGRESMAEKRTANGRAEEGTAAASPPCRAPVGTGRSEVFLLPGLSAVRRPDEIEIALRLPDGRVLRLKPGDVLLRVEARVRGTRVVPTASAAEERP